MTSKLEIRHKQRQDEIINAARRCFRRCGFHAASMSQIASEAQLSVGQIYRYFANKDAIIEEMVRRIGNDSNLLIVFYVQIMPDDFVMQLHRF